MNRPFIRPAAVAGLFYPDDPVMLSHTVHTYITEGHASKPRPVPKAMIAPHAGYIYSGPIAGSAYACLTQLRDSVTRVLLLGPSHHVGFSGIAGTSATAFSTPLGDVPVDMELGDHLASASLLHIRDAAHREEHGLEVHLPFLQVCLHQFNILPMVVGDASAQQVAALLEASWGGPETLVLVSSDLSHYLPYARAVSSDQATSDAIRALTPDAIKRDQACGRIPVQGLLIEAARHHLVPHVLDVRNSGDTAGDRKSVVGYGAYVFSAS